MSYPTNEVDTNAEVVLAAGTYGLEDLISEIFDNDRNICGSIPLLKSWCGGFANLQLKTRRIHGYIVDGKSGETLPGAAILLRGTSKGMVSNEYGYFSLKVPVGVDEFQVQYMGYQSYTGRIGPNTDSMATIALEPVDFMLEDVVIRENQLQAKVSNTESGTTTLEMSRISTMPAFAGEADVIKAIQLLPGVQSVGEGSSAYFVRGGNYDQNLILLDEAPVYNASHALGFFSVFNQDAIKNLKFYKTHMPARFGGRLSSLLDVRMKEGNNQKFRVSGGIGLISSRLTAEGPIVKDRSSFIISARRTYADLVWRALSADEATKNTSIYFYDLNAKANYRINDKNTLYLSGFFGRDVNKIEVQQYKINWGNQTATLRWNHVFSNKWFSNLSLIYSNYDYGLTLQGFNTLLDWKSRIRDYTLKMGCRLLSQ